ncbi:CHASE4 domain-containing protein [Desulfococcaceae bacterium HSG9]|nr:CHASE4 domain-containing protein [Desulfococcaceae bacterium HSG9]
MSIRTKILSIVGITFLILMATLTIISRMVVLRGFVELESQDVHTNVERAISEIKGTLSNLKSIPGDWGPWDDTYAFIQDRNESYIKSNLNTATLHNLGINFMLFVNRQKKLIYSFAVDLHTKERVTLYQKIWEKIRSGNILIEHKNTKSSLAGIIIVDQHPVFVASRPILKSDFNGPIRGALIVGRYVGKDEIQRLGQTTHLSIQAFAFNDKRMPPDFQDVKLSFAKDKPIIIKIENDDTVSGYALQKDVQGNPGVILRVRLPRKIYRQGMLTFYYYLFSLLAVGLVFFILIMLFLEKAILSPLTWLSSEVSGINHSHTEPKNILVSRKDELGRLAEAINAMLMQIYDKTNALEKANKELKSDIIQRQKTETAWRQSEEKFRIISEQSLLAIAIIQDDLLKYTNLAFSNIVEYPVEEMLTWENNEYSKFDHPEDRDFVMEQARKKQKGDPDVVTNYNSRVVTKTGVIKWVEIYSKTVIYQGKNAILLTVIDITAKMDAEKERKNLQTQLQRAEKMEAIGTLAGGVAHDLNNVLSGIVSYPDLILMQLPDDSPLKKPIATIRKSGQKAAAIVQDMLTLARRGVTITETVNLNSTVKQYLQSPEYEKLISFYPGVTVAVNLDKTLMNNIGSSVQLSKTIMNLVSNAVEAMPVGGEITISTENRYIDKPVKSYDHVEEGDYVVVAVSDTGVGISAEDQAQIFEPFYTKKAMGRSGTGLGMAVVWGTVKDHRGYIDIESNVGKGTTFTLYIPATRKQSAQDKESPAIETYQGEGEKILVVDDVKTQREVASNILSELGYAVTAVSSGEEAVEFVREHKVDLLILDMIMAPGMDGLDTYQKILEIRPDQKAVIASGFSQTERVEEAHKLGAGEYIRKPYTLEKIGVAVRKELKK